MKLYFTQFTLILLLWLPGPIVNAVDLDENRQIRTYQSKLDKLYKSIDKVKQHLKSSLSKRSNVVTELHQLETTISKNARKLQKTTSNINNLDNRIKKLKKLLRQLDIKVNQQRTLLAEQLRAAYVTGAQQQLKMLLNQQDPEMLGRLQVYFEYLNRSRKEHIRSYRQSIQQKQAKELELSEALATQQTQLASQKSQKRTLGKQRRQRNQLLAQLDREIKDQESTLTDLKSSRDRIENLLMSLGELLADIPARAGNEAAFETRKGKLPWPVAGRFIANFGTSKSQGDLRWNGVLISSQYGDPVQAISHGRVVFSDWLQGFGFITIVDHGNGYMSLYGHNESLLKQAGDWIEAGEVIATVGDSGGHTTPAVYFEIRERGKPVNPSSWCSNKIRHTL